ncbi:MAG: hypothetical protein WKF91_16780 [Segetibacter sp.]
MSEELIHSVIDQVDAHEKKISELNKKTAQIPEYTERLKEFDNSVNILRSDVKKLQFPEKEIQQLSDKLETGIQIFRQPVKQKIVHHHHAPKVLWATGILFLIVCLVSIGWYQTVNKLDLYKANDTKYRYLKLQAEKGLSEWLRIIDKREREDATLRDKVIAKEEENQAKLETLQRATEMEKEVKELKQQVKKADTAKQKKKPAISSKKRKTATKMQVRDKGK